jgi:hypothetical protein
MNIEFWSICRSSVWFLDTIVFNVRRFLSRNFDFRPRYLLTDDVFPWFVYVIITLETAALDTPNKVAVFNIENVY